VIETAGRTGGVPAVRRPGTARVLFSLVLEDEFGLVNVIVKPDLYESQRASGALGAVPPIVREELQRRDGITNLIYGRSRSCR
jgi:error-prone DNA polymerase